MAAQSNITLPPPFNSSSTQLDLITQGAEGCLYKTTFLDSSTPAALKYRAPKPWRHPTLDKRLTRGRILAEARVLVKCNKAGVAVPEVLGLGVDEGWVAMSWIEGASVKAVLWGRPGARGLGSGSVQRAAQTGSRDGEVETGQAKQDDEGKGVKVLLRKIGVAVGTLHAVGVVHGDLTTSNMILRPANATKSGADSTEPDISIENSEAPLHSLEEAPEGDIVLIDFGLASQTVQEEDRAVDLYVLERAFASTHPREEALFGVVLEGYATSFPGAKIVLRKLEDVRMRGRKRSMIG